MSKHKRSATRKIVAASTIGVLAASGAAFGIVSSASADGNGVVEIADGLFTTRSTVTPQAGTVTGPLVIERSRGGGYQRFVGNTSNPRGVQNFATAEQAALAPGLPVYTFPSVGEQGTIKNADGMCLVLGNTFIANVNQPYGKFASCTGAIGSSNTSQLFTLVKDRGFRVEGVKYINVDNTKHQAWIYSLAAWSDNNRLGPVWQPNWDGGSIVIPPGNANAAASAAASGRADGDNNPAAVAAAQAAANNDATSVADAAADRFGNSAAKTAGNQVTTAAADAAQNVSSNPSAAGSVAAKAAATNDNSSNTQGGASVAANASPNSASKAAAIGTSSTNASGEANGNRNAAASASASANADGNENAKAEAAAQAAANADGTSAASAAADISAKAAAQIAGNQLTTASSNVTQDADSSPSSSSKAAAQAAAKADNSTKANGAVGALRKVGQLRSSKSEPRFVGC